MLKQFYFQTKLNCEIYYFKNGVAHKPICKTKSKTGLNNTFQLFFPVYSMPNIMMIKNPVNQFIIFM